MNTAYILISCEVGAENVLITTGHQLLFRQLDDDFFVAIALDPSGSLGKARYLVRSLLRNLQEAL